MIPIRDHLCYFDSQYQIYHNPPLTMPLTPKAMPLDGPDFQMLQDSKILLNCPPQ